MDFFRFRIELGNIERTARHAILAADAVVLMKIDDAVGVLDDRAIGGTRAQAAGIGAVHTAVLAHQPAKRAVVGDVLIEPDQIVVIPFRIRHRLVGVVEAGLAKRIAVPFETRDFARLATDAGGDVDEFRDAVVARGIVPRNRTGVSGDCFDLQSSVRHFFRLSPVLLKSP